MGIPNMLSIFRIILIPFFSVSYLTLGGEYRWVPASILALSGLTDMLDGIIARKYNMITYLGKILDPVADKLTLFAVCLTLAVTYRPLFVLAGIFFIKEILMLFGGLAIVKSGRKIAGSKWFGKVATAVLYICFMIFILSPALKADDPVAIALMAIMAAVIVFAFIMYIPIYSKIRNDKGI